MSRLKSIRQQQLSMPGSFPPPQPQPGAFAGPAGQQQQPQQMTQQQMLFRQQQAQAQAQAAQAQANGMTPGQAQMMQQQMQAQQAQQQVAQHALMQQQRFTQQGGPAPSPSMAARPPPGQQGQQVMYQQNLQPPNGAGPSHSPGQPSPHIMHQQIPGQPGVTMPSPHVKPMRPPAMNGPAPGQPSQQGPINPMMRAATPQQQISGQFAHPQHTPQQTGPSPVAQSPAPMTPQQQQLLHAQAAQAQAMQQRAQHTLMQAQQYGHPGGPPGQAVPMGPAGQGIPLQQGQGGPSGPISRDNLQAMQQQQMQAAANQMYSSLGIGQINPQVMHSSAQALGLGGRDVGAMSDEDRVSIVLYRELVLTTATSDSEVPDEHERESETRNDGCEWRTSDSATTANDYPTAAATSSRYSSTCSGSSAYPTAGHAARPAAPTRAAGCHRVDAADARGYAGSTNASASCPAAAAAANAEVRDIPRPPKLS